MDWVLQKSLVPVGCWVLLFTGLAVAQENDGDARALFEEGTVLFDDGKFLEAAETFRLAYALRSSWKMFFNIGQSEAAAQRYGLALEAFENYLVKGGDDVPMEKKDMVLKEIERLRLMVGVIDLVAEPGSVLLVDDYKRGTFPFDGLMRVAAGSHNIKIVYDDQLIYDKDMRIAGGMATRIDVLGATSMGTFASGTDDTHETAVDDGSEDAPSSISTAPASSDSKKKARSPMWVAGIVTGGVGVAALGVGGGFLIKSLIEDKRAANLDPRDPANHPAIAEYNDDILPMNRAMTITGLVVGGVGIITGGVLLMLDKRNRQPASVSLKPSVGGVAISF